MADKDSFVNVAQRLKVKPEVYRAILQQALYDLRVAMPGVIQSFNAAKQTCTVQLAVRDKININLVPTDLDMPLLVDVPVVMPRASTFAITLPIKKGDECLVVFADMCIDAWWQSGGTQNAQVDKRRHDLSDAFAIVGTWSQPRVLSSYDADALQIRTADGNTVIELRGSAINIKTNNSDITLNAQGSGKVQVTSASEVDITAPTIKIGGKDWATHKHSGVQTGGGQTGGVV